MLKKSHEALGFETGCLVTLSNIHIFVHILNINIQAVTNYSITAKHLHFQYYIIRNNSIQFDKLLRNPKIITLSLPHVASTVESSGPGFFFFVVTYGDTVISKHECL